MKGTHQMTDSMKKVGQAMKRMNGIMNPAKLQQMMQEFAMESEKMGMTEEMVGDMMDDAMGDEDEEEEVEEQVNKVLAEIGLDFADGLGEAPTSQPVAQGAAAEKQEEKDAGVSELESRLENLKR
jgi:division protein CdvB (Snf7/Vps24/ESCRT-III family)